MLADVQKNIDSKNKQVTSQTSAGKKSTTPAKPGEFSFLSGGGEMRELIRAFDWSRTPIGGPSQWSPALKTMLQFMLANRFPHILWWGPEYVQFYNDAYMPIAGAKHPDRLLGLRGSEGWSEIWHIIGPLVDRPFQGGPPTWDEDILLELNRHGFWEESHFTIAYSPVPDENAEGGIGGVLATVHEITEKVVAERRVLALRDLGTQLANAKTADEVCVTAAKTLATYEKDVPFALLYLTEQASRQARLAAIAGAEAGQNYSPQTEDLELNSEGGWPFGKARETGVMQIVDDLPTRFAKLPKGPWSTPPNTAVVLPLPSSNPQEPVGFLIAGVSSRLRLNQFYKDFFDLARAQIATAIGNTRAFEQERKRAEALAELDRAKTAFFNNVSHEFRTPLTLLLGPAEEMLASKSSPLPPEAAEQVDVIRRNALRLQRLVNTLLDFSRIEAGRIKGRYTATDLAAFTSDLAAVFRAAMEKAGLKFIVDVPRPPESVYVDREMWEKIIFNLLSNAFKFTWEGQVRISLAAKDGGVVLTVADSGVGIPAEELPNIFKRFHRVEGRGSRNYEGSGIGLAFVQELVKLHGGNISVHSHPGEGTTFEVWIPFGKEHLPVEQINAAPVGEAKAAVGEAFVEEALTWLPEHHTEIVGSEQADVVRDTGKPRVLLAEDNADMRHYARRLLETAFDVEAVANGALALAAARKNPPDLILSDVMMPKMSGLELVRAVRADDRLRFIPVILLSARAGEEDRIEGATRLADDYVTKPFSARELLARISTQIKLARDREEADRALRRNEERFRAFVTTSSDAVYQMNPDWSEMRHLEGRNFIPDTQDPDRHWFDRYIHPEDAERVRAAIQDAIHTKSTYSLEHRVIRVDGTTGWTYSRAIPLLDSHGDIIEWFGAAADVTERHNAEAALREEAHVLELLKGTGEAIAAQLELPLVVQMVTDAATKLCGAKFGAFFYNVITPGGEAYLLYTLSGAPREAFEKFGLPRNTPVFNPTFTGQGVVRSDDITKDPRYGTMGPHFGMPKDHLPVRSYLAIPVISRAGEVIGGLFFGHPDIGVFTERSERILLGVAAQASIAIDNARLYEAAQREISQRKRMEGELREAQEKLSKHADNLEQEVQARTASLRDALTQLEEFSYSVSHDLRSPLRAIAGYNRAFREDFGAALPPEAQSYLDKIERSADRMEHLVKDVLTFSRVARGELELRPISLQRFIEDVREQNPSMHAPAVDMKIIALDSVMADEAALGQAISNLLGNAVKFVPVGETPVIRVRSEPAGDRVRLWVEDSGIGIDEKYRKQLFGMFQRLPGNASYDGTGIGLAIVRKTVERMGGTVGMESNKPKGSRFWIELKGAA